VKKAYLWSNGCERRLLDKKRFSDYLFRNNYYITNKPEDANLIIVFTCSFIRRITNESLNKIIVFQKKYDAELIVAGCLPAIDKKKLGRIFKGKTIITSDLNKRMYKIDDFFPENKLKFSEIDDANTYNIFNDKSSFLNNFYNKNKKHIFKFLFNRHSLYYSPLYEKSFYIRISWGCLNKCSYCGIKKAIIPFESKSINKCIEEFKKGLKEGYKNFIISGDDTGSYGLDINRTFPDLLDAMISFPGKYNLTIRDFNPRWIVKYINDLEEIFRRNKIHYIDAPIQAGTTRILKLMKRYEQTEKMKDAFTRLKVSTPDLVINTHYILGFPTETEDEFKQTLSFIKDVSFDNIIVIPFSPKAGTIAETIEPKISDEEIMSRMEYTKKFFKNSGYHIKMRPVDNHLLIGKKIISFK
jgi:ribosomal protein S12 methylthiotransferase